MDTAHPNPVSLLSVGNASAFQVSYTGGVLTAGLFHVQLAANGTPAAEFQNPTYDCTFTPSSAGTFSCSSDEKFKTDIGDTGDVLSSINEMRIRDYTMRSNGERQTSVIAQEMMSTHPQMVHENPQGFLTVDQPNPWVLVRAIQELEADNQVLRQDFETYKAAHP